jgi:RNA polymerase sigma factor (sigma-70 family)
MSDEPAFRDLIGRVRAGDAAAAEELVRCYESVLRRMVRVRLLDARLRRLVDASDICQSVFASFFVRAALGQYDLQKPDDLLKLLATMARNKVVDKVRHSGLDRHADGRIPVAELPEHAQVAPGASPSQQLTLRELLEEARRRLTPEERRILELRQQGLQWAEIAVEVGGTPEALRKRYTRALTIVAEQLGLDSTG